MRAPCTTPPATLLPRTFRPGTAETPRPIWHWRGTGPALTPRGLVPLDIEGAAPVVMTPSGPGLRIERGTTNFVTNPSFELDLAGWNAVAGASISRETSGGGAFGSAYARVAVNANGDGIRFAGTGNAAHGQQYAASVYLRAATPSDVGKTVQFFLDTSGGQYEIVATDHILTMEWARVVIHSIWTQSAHLGWSVVARDSIGQSGFAFLADAAQYESGTTSSYTDGTMGSGFSWTATAHSSASVRQPSSVLAAVPESYPDRGSLAFSCHPDWSSPSVQQRTLLQYVRGSITLAITADPSGAWRFVSRTDLAEHYVQVEQSHLAGDHVQLVATWSPAHLKLCLGATQSNGLRVTPATEADTTQMQLGHSQVEHSHFAGILGSLSVWDRELRPAEIAAIAHGEGAPSGWP